MKIENKNKFKIEKEIFLHDYIFAGFEYNYQNNKISVFVLDHNESGCIEILYNNVIGFQMTSCDFWGCSPHILSWECLDEKNSNIINRLYYEKEKEKYEYSRLLSKNKYFETVIILSSGDKLDIACEYIIYMDRNRTGDGSKPRYRTGDGSMS